MLSRKKIGREILKLGDIEIEKHRFYCHKNPIFIKNVDIEKVLVSNKISSAEKSYKYYDHKVKPLHIMFLKTSAYVKSCDGKTKSVYFLTEDDELLEKYNTVWYKVSIHIQGQRLNSSILKYRKLLFFKM